MSEEFQYKYGETSVNITVQPPQFSYMDELSYVLIHKNGLPIYIVNGKYNTHY